MGKDEKSHSKLTVRKRLALEVARKLRRNAQKMHPLKELFWECTLRCNLSCKHCGSDCHTTAGTKDMPAADFLKVVDSIAPHVNPHHTMIVITGGEALVRTDLEVVGRALYDRGFPWGFVTNGLLLTRKRLDSLMAAGLHAVTVSLDGFAEDHNWMRGHSLSFERATEAIRMLSEEKELVWDVVTCVNRRNYPYLKEFREFLYSIGVRDWRIFTIFPVGRAAQYPEFQLNDDEFTGVLSFIRETRQEGKVHLNYGCEGFLGGYEGEVRDGFYNCHAGVTVGSVLIDGSISACPSIRSNFHQGNIYQDDFMDVWNNRFQSFRNRDWMKKGQCADCGLFRYCEGNGMHLRDEQGDLLFCHHSRIKK